MDFLRLAQENKDYIINIRREIHRYPELGFQEFLTTDVIAKQLDEMGVSYRRLNPTGVVAEIHGNKKGAENRKIVALRADIDALPIKEETGCSYSSEHDGVMHACGHDTHAAMLLGAANLLSKTTDLWSGTVRLIFQPAEEIAKGAACIIEQGVLEDVECIFALHIGVGATSNYVMSLKGPIFASANRFKIVVQGKQCHAAFPHSGIDPVLAGSSIVTALQSFTSREFNALEPLVVTVGSFQSDGSHNVVSGEAVLEGTIRTYSRDIREKMKEAFYRLVENTASAYRCKALIEYIELTDVLINNDKVVDIARNAAKKIVGRENLKDGDRFMGSEDFSEYTAKVPGAFFTLGAGGRYPSHHAKFEIEEGVLPTGAAVYAQFAIDALEGEINS